MNSFELLNPFLKEKLAELKIEKPTKVQDAVIPLILEGKSVVFQSETGTGKTFAYLLPLVKKIQECEERISCKVIITAPTVELTSQINMAAKSISDCKTALFTGGAPLKRQIETLKEKPEIIVGTPGRLIELIQLKKLKTANLMALVFDETDRMLKKEAFDDTNLLRSLIPENCQIIANSATINNPCKRFFAESTFVTIEDEDILKKNITHWAIFAETREKIEMLRKFLIAEKPAKALIFTSRSDQVENIFRKLTYKKVNCMALHAKADKTERKTAIDRFRSGKCQVLVTSDLSARGLDIPNITHVIQMDLPSDDDFFIHRSGRTARAGKKGINVVIGDEYEMRHYCELEKKLGLKVYPKDVVAGKIISFD